MESCSCYQKTESGYESALACDMNTLATQGVQTLADLKMASVFILHRKLVPIFEAHLDFMDLYQRTVISSEDEFYMGKSDTRQPFEKIVENNGALAKQYAEQDALLVANNLAIKLSSK